VPRPAQRAAPARIVAWVETRPDVRLASEIAGLKADTLRDRALRAADDIGECRRRVDGEVMEWHEFEEVLRRAASA